MTHHHEHLDLALEEFERYGLRGEISNRGKHLEIAWATPQGRRFVIAPCTPSDWRANLNLRRDVRSMLRKDNLQPKAINELSFQRAMSLPKAPVYTQESILQKDVEALTEMVFELQGQLDLMKQYISEALREQLRAMTVVSRVSFGETKPELSVEIRETYAEMLATPIKKEKKTDLVWNLLSTNWIEIKTLVKSTGINRSHLNTILQGFRRKGLIENGLRGQWRKKA